MLEHTFKNLLIFMKNTKLLSNFLYANDFILNTPKTKETSCGRQSIFGIK